MCMQGGDVPKHFCMPESWLEPQMLVGRTTQPSIWLQHVICSKGEWSAIEDPHMPKDYKWREPYKWEQSLSFYSIQNNYHVKKVFRSKQNQRFVLQNSLLSHFTRLSNNTSPLNRVAHHDLKRNENTRISVPQLSVCMAFPSHNSNRKLEDFLSRV